MNCSDNDIYYININATFDVLYGDTLEFIILLKPEDYDTFIEMLDLYELSQLLVYYNNTLIYFTSIQSVYYNNEFLYKFEYTSYNYS